MPKRTFDLIVCRNVFVYFPRDAVAKVMTKFAACLAPDGILLLSATDPVVTTVDGLAFHFHGSVSYFGRG